MPVVNPKSGVTIGDIECGAIATDKKEDTQTVKFAEQDNFMIGKHFVGTVGSFEVSLFPQGLGRVSASIRELGSGRVVESNFNLNVQPVEISTSNLVYMDDVVKRTGAMVTCVKQKP